MKLKSITSACIAIVIMFSLTACQPEILEPTDLSTIEKGQKDVNFGKYTWTVLEIRDDTALLLTNEIVEKYPFQEEFETTDWSGSDIRKYMNDLFLSKNFTKDEQEKLVRVFNNTPDNAWFSTSSGGNTLDWIFLLSLEEVVNYFGDSGQLENGNPEGDYSIYSIDDEYNENRIARYEGEKTWWWLRTMGNGSKVAVPVTHSGRLDVGGRFVDDEFGIRPAVWVQMN